MKDSKHHRPNARREMLKKGAALGAAAVAARFGFPAIVRA